jgi:hypothetical protein
MPVPLIHRKWELQLQLFDNMRPHRIALVRRFRISLLQPIDVSTRLGTIGLIKIPTKASHWGLLALTALAMSDWRASRVITLRFIAMCCVPVWNSVGLSAELQLPPSSVDLTVALAEH